MFKLERKLSPDEFIDTFFAVNRRDHQRAPHPWDVLFRGGQCTREQLQGWAKERYYFTKQVPIKEYSILYNCPHTDVRRMWLPKAIEEEGEDLIGKAGKPHPEYWLDVCVGLGLDREFVKRSEPLFGVKFAVDSFANVSLTDCAIVTGAQVSKTTSLTVGLLWSIRNSPCSALVVMPTETMARAFSETRLRFLQPRAAAVRALRAVPHHADYPRP